MRRVRCLVLDLVPCIYNLFLQKSISAFDDFVGVSTPKIAAVHAMELTVRML